MTRRPALAAALLAVTVVAAHLLVLGGEFVYDDVVIVQQNPRLRSWSGLAEVWRTTYWGDAYEAGLWRPVTLSTFVIEYQLFGPRPWAFRLTNFVLHLACTAGVFLLLRRVGMPPPAAYLSALVFGVHPVHAEVVTSVVGRTDLLATLFAVLALLLFLRFRAGSGALVLSGIGACYLAGLLSKEVMIALPLVFAGWDLLGRRDAGRPGIDARLAHPYLLLAAITLLYLPVRAGVIGSLGPEGGNQVFHGEPFHVRLGTMLGVLCDYVGMFLVPVNLAADFPYPPGGAPGFDLRSVLGLAGLAAACLVAIRRRGVTAFALVIFLAGLAPVSNILIVTGIVKAARLLYLPSIGLSAAAGAVLWVAWRRPAARVAVVAVLLLLGAIHAKMTWTWRTNERLWRYTLRISPDSSKGLYNLGAIHARRGQALLGEGRPEDAAPDLLAAERLFREGIRVNPLDGGLPFALGRLYLLRRDYPAAERALREALLLDLPPRRAFEATVGLAEAFANTGRLPRARLQLEAALEGQPGAHEVRLHLARVLIDLGEPDLALHHLDEVLGASPPAPEPVRASAARMRSEISR